MGEKLSKHTLVRLDLFKCFANPIRVARVFDYLVQKHKRSEIEKKGARRGNVLEPLLTVVDGKLVHGTSVECALYSRTRPRSIFCP